MASTSESGHHKNVSNFTATYQILEEMGQLYRPINAQLELAALAPMLTALSEAMTQLNLKKAHYNNAVAVRRSQMALLNQKVTRSLNLAKSLDVAPAQLDNLKSLAFKIRGYRVTQKKKSNQQPANSISNYQLSYDNRLANWAAYTQQLASLKGYQPLEPELAIAAFKSFHQEMLVLNSELNKASNELLSARNHRNQLLYHSPTAALKMAQQCRLYVKAIGTPAIPFYKALAQLQFKFPSSNWQRS